MNIAFGHEIFLPESNGIVTATFDQAKHLIELGHNVYFFVPESKELTEEYLNIEFDKSTIDRYRRKLNKM